MTEPIAGWLADPFWRRTGETLVHSLWQGALLALVAAVILRPRFVRSARGRYAGFLMSLAIVAALPAVTFALLDSTPNPPTSFTVDPGVELPTHSAATPADATSTWNFELPWLSHEASSWIAALWIIGLMIQSLRLAIGAAAIHRERRSGVELSGEWPKRIANLARRLGLRRVPCVHASSRVRGAAAFGLWKPVVLLPAEWFLELPAGTLEAVLAHELAHIRRHDLWVNALQRVVETALFYHPAVWWLSGRVRAEREWCCDEAAVIATGDRVEYARALERVAERVLAAPRPAWAIGFGERKMVMLNRVRNVLGLSPEGERSGWRWAWAAVLALPVGLWWLQGGSAVAVGDEEDKPAATAEEGKKDEARKEEAKKEEAKKDGDAKREERAEEAKSDEERERRREEDRPREGGDRPREGGDRPREGGDRPREGGDRPREGGDRPREGERRPDAGPAREREGDRRPEPRREGGDRPVEPRREGDRPAQPQPRRDGEGPRPDRREPDGRRPEGNPGNVPVPEMMRAIQELREEVARLRRELDELRANRGGNSFVPRDGDRRFDGGRPGPNPPRDRDRRPDEERRPDGERRPEADRRPDGPRPDGPRPPGPQRDGDRRPDADRPRDGERRPEGDRPRDGERRDGERREGDRPRDGERRPDAEPKRD